MLFRSAVLGALILGGAASCSKSEGGDAIGSAAGSAGSAAKPGSASGGGFSADLAKQLGPAGADSRSGSVATDSDKAGSASGEPAKPGTGAVAASDAARSTVATGDAKPSPAVGGDGPRSTSPASAGDLPKSTTPAAATKSPASAATTGDPPRAAVALPSPGPVKVPAELAAIKLSLLPNWDRDVDEAGTFQYVVRIKGTQSTKTFSFRYGYDDPKAPADRDQYKKFLQDSKVMAGEIRDRQRGSAWFLEGVDPSGLPTFRYVVLYGGKRLICYGSLYKDADSNRLGDDRDQTVIQAKQICESLAL